MYDVIVIGAGLSGLSAASLLAKRGLRAAVIDKNKTPGGTCGIFKRDGSIFDQGCGMMFGFGENGYNSHRFLFNLLEEPISVIRHQPMYAMDFGSWRIVLDDDIDKMVAQLSERFPEEGQAFRRFYADLRQMYHEVMVETPMFTTADESDIHDMIPQIKKHPRSYLRFLSYMNISAEKLLKKYFKTPEVFQFYDKLTMTYCYTTLKESPAILAAIMFIENHVGGSYYPAGSTLYLPGKLEKVIEEHGGEMILGQKAAEILIKDGKAYGVRLDNGECLYGHHIIYSGTVWNLYEKLLDRDLLKDREIKWERSQKRTDSSVVLYAKVKQQAIPDGTLPAELLIGSEDELDEEELTVFIMSLDDQTLTDEGCHIVTAIGASFEKWTNMSRAEYQRKKYLLKERLLATMEKRFPGFRDNLVYCTVATPRTMKRFTEKNWGACAGPKQMMGQHMLKRLHTRNRFKNLYCCGESTVMGTGTPTVTISGIAAANAVLKEIGLEPAAWKPDMDNYVTVLKPPFTQADKASLVPDEIRDCAAAAWRCQFCENPACQSSGVMIDVPGIMRRVAVGNITGAGKLIEKQRDRYQSLTGDSRDFIHLLSKMEDSCILVKRNQEPVAIQKILLQIGGI